MTIDTELILLMLPSLIMGLLIQATHLPLGINIIKRGIIFLDIAIAQIAALGAIIFKVYFSLSQGFIINQFFIIGFAILGGLIFYFIHKVKQKISNNIHELEAIIGIIYITSASLAMLIISKSPHSSEELNYILSGQIIFVSPLDITYTALMYTIVLLIWLNKDITKNDFYFYIVFSISIAIAVQFAGVYLVFSFLIIPALIFYNSKYPLTYGFIFSLVCLLLGIYSSLITDYPTGISIVLSYVALGLTLSIIRLVLKIIFLRL